MQLIFDPDLDRPNVRFALLWQDEHGNTHRDYVVSQALAALATENLEAVRSHLEKFGREAFGMSLLSFQIIEVSSFEAGLRNSDEQEAEQHPLPRHSHLRLVG